jgi:lipopolysaccharide transport system permease protein
VCLCVCKPSALPTPTHQRTNAQPQHPRRNPRLKTELSITVYTPEHALRHPLRMLRDMVRDLCASRELAWRLFVRDISAKYRQTFLGYVWAFLPPLVTTFTFVLLNSQGVFRVGETALPYAAYVMIGTLLWQVFVDAMQTPIRVVTYAKPMLAKINFPREAILLGGLYEVLFNFAIRLVLLLAVFLWFRIVPPMTMLLAPLGVVALIALGTMIGVVLTPVGLLYQDIGQGLVLITGFWMLLTPVVYPPPASGLLATLAKWNPVSPLILTTRDWLTVGNTDYLPGFLVVLAMTFVLLLFGWIMYRLAMPHLIERMSA